MKKLKRGREWRAKKKKYWQHKYDAEIARIWLQIPHPNDKYYGGVQLTEPDKKPFSWFPWICFLSILAGLLYGVCNA